MPKKKVLVINSKCPYPVQDGAAIRSMQMIRMLARIFDVDLLYTYKGGSANVTGTALQDLCRNVYAFRTSSIGMILRGLKGIFYLKPLQCSYFYSSKANKFIRKNLDKYDLIFCNNIRTAQYVIDVPCYKIIDYVDAISMNYLGASDKANLLWRYVYKIEYRRLLAYEVRSLFAFDKHIIISNIDKNFILDSAQEIKKEIFVINNSVSFDNELVIPNKSSDLVFVGSMFYEPNIVAVKLFVRHILPLILTKIPSTKFYIVGARPTRAVCALASDHVIVTGFVDDPKDYLRKASLVVVPMYSGAGVQNKILEAMSIGCCVVTTKIGSEGLEHIIDGKELFIRSEYNEFANTVVDLINDQLRRERVGKAAKEYISRYLTFDAIFDRFKSIFH